MIIFGTRGVTTTPESGQFHCPGCATSRPYELKRVRRFFTLYFIPVIPMDVLGEYIECIGCRETWKPSVLKHDPSAGKAEFEAEYHRAIRRVMVLMLLADGEVDEAEIEVVRGIYGSLSKKQVTREDVQREIAEARSASQDVRTYLSGLVGQLNEQGKDLVFKAAYFVAKADGKFTDEEQDLLLDIGKTLELSKAHVSGLMGELSRAA